MTRKTFQLDDNSPRPLVCDIDTLVDTRMLVQANSGGGKSYVLRRILEQTHGRVQQLVLDPEGEFSSLRKRFDYVHAAAVDGDCLAHPRSAVLLAQRLLKLGVSAILDLYELKAHDRVLFVRLFTEALINAPKSLWHPVLVVLDEAHVFCPQSGSAESAAAVIDLASRGRKRGFSSILATQRIQKLHKDAAAECNNKLIGRTTLDVDLARAADELGFAKTMWRDLRELPAGDFFASGPAFNLRGVSRVHIGAVQTPHPKAGSRIAYTAPPPTSAIRALLPQLADLPAEAEQQAKTVATLQGEVAALKKELTKASKAVAVVDPTRSLPGDAAKIRALKKGLADAMKIIVQISAPDLFKAPGPSIDDVQRALDTAAKSIETHLAKQLSERSHEITRLQLQAKKLTASLAALLDGDVEVDVTVKRNEPFVAASIGYKSKPQPPAPTLTDGNWLLPKGQRAILTVLAQSANHQSSKSRVALLAGYSSNGGGFNNYLATLRTQGLMRSNGEMLLITDDGLKALGPYESLPTGTALHEFWLGKCGKAERAVLTELLNAYPDPVTKNVLAQNTGYEPDGGGFNNALSRLRTMELIEGRGEMRAAAVLFDG